MARYKKAIRDKIPDIIRRSGASCKVIKMSNEKFLPKMELKLLEEVKEYGKSRKIEELADILEVVYRISELKGTNKDKLEQIRRKKKAQRGGFGKNLFLLSTAGR